MSFETLYLIGIILIFLFLLTTAEEMKQDGTLDRIGMTKLFLMVLLSVVWPLFVVTVFIYVVMRILKGEKT
jgi:hypothetical protein